MTLTETFVCPRDHAALTLHADELRCEAGHAYPVEDGIPVFLLDEDRPKHADHRLDLDLDGGDAVDPFVQQMIVGTCGNFYAPLRGKLPRYPIPDMRYVPVPGDGRRLLDIGCSWGRWSVAASKAGYEVVGIDGALQAVSAARRVSRQVGVAPTFAVADARHLPFRPAAFDVVFSYSVLQHFSETDVAATLDDVARVLVPGGTSVIEMATAVGLRNLLARAKYRATTKDPQSDLFRVRYWPVRELEATWERAIGPTRVEVDSYLFINGQPADADLMPARFRAAIAFSEGLRRLSDRVTPLKRAADSVYMVSRKG